MILLCGIRLWIIIDISIAIKRYNECDNKCDSECDNKYNSECDNEYDSEYDSEKIML